MMPTGSASDPKEAKDRAAIEHIIGRSLSGPWPAEALAPGTRVTVIHDPEWDGPWRDEFSGTIDAVGPPEDISHARALPEELKYEVALGGARTSLRGCAPPPGLG